MTRQKAIKQDSQPSRLITEFTDMDTDTLTDYLSMLARDIEDAMIQCGAVPGKDYTILDVFKLVATMYRANEQKDQA